MPSLPIMLNVRKRRCKIIGGGKVALRRTKTLLDSQAEVEIIAPKIDDEILKLDITYQKRSYKNGDLEGAFLVVIATDNQAVNKAASEEAKANGALINRADNPEKGDLTIPAHTRYPPITIAVDTARSSPRAAVQIRDQLADSLDKDWVKLLEIIGEYRKEIIKSKLKPQTRKKILGELTDASIMNILKTQSEQELRKRYERLLDGL